MIIINIILLKKTSLKINYIITNFIKMIMHAIEISGEEVINIDKKLKEIKNIVMIKILKTTKKIVIL